MSRLIRISTEDDNGIFNEQFEEDLVIDENSTIALQSANFSRLNSHLELNHLNEVFRLSTGVDDTEYDDLVVIESHRTMDTVITHNNFRDLLFNITASANTTLSPFALYPNAAGQGAATKAQDNSGAQYLVSVNTDNKVVFETRKEAAVKWTFNTDFIADALEDGVTLVNDAGGNYLTRDAFEDDASLENGYLATKRPMNMGASYFSVRPTTLGNADAPAQWTVRPTPGRENLIDAGTGEPVGFNANFDPDQAGQSGFVMAIIDDQTRSLLVQGYQGLSLEDLYAYVGWKNDLQVPYFFGYGTEVDNARPENNRNPAEDFNELAIGFPHYYSKLLYEANDDVGIGIDKGSIKFFVRRADGDQEQFLNDDMEDEARAAQSDMGLDYEKRYYWALFLIGAQDNTRLKFVEATADPFVAHQELAARFGSFQTTGLAAAPAPAAGTFIRPALSFQYAYAGGVYDNNELREFLGFSVDQTTIQAPVGALKHQFIAHSASHGVTDVETYNVLLNNIPLESYDTVPKGRQNLLYSLVVERQLGAVQQISFNSNYNIPLRIKNKNKLMLRTIQARIVNGEYEKVDLQGLSSLVLLIGKDS